MVQEYLLLVIILVFAVLLLVMLGQKFKISYPIFLTIAGLIISLIPGIPNVELNPDLVFLILLPPILYEGAWYTSWPDFLKWRRPISLLAFALVFFTALVVAFFTQSLIPGFTVAMGFLLGGIISPTDSIASISVLKGVKIPKRLLTIIEGESLVNDASGLIVMRFALAAILTGQFVFQGAVFDFAYVSIVGILIGLLIGAVFYCIHRFLPTTPDIDTALTLLTPYVMYIVAEYFKASGVIAVISGGLLLSSQQHAILTYQSRIQATNVWSAVVFLINGTVFMLIGLGLPGVVAGLDTVSLQEAILFGLLISLLVIVLRMVGAFLTTFVPRKISPSIRKRERSAGWKGAFIVGYTGMRGVVSLAAALSIPLFLDSGDPFPQRNLIIFITFVVIIVTLVIQGILLPWVLRTINIAELDANRPVEEQQADLEIRLKNSALRALERNYSKEVASNQLLANLVNHLEGDVKFSRQTVESLECGACGKHETTQYREVMHQLIKVQRTELHRSRNSNSYDMDVIRKQNEQLDLDELKLR